MPPGVKSGMLNNGAKAVYSCRDIRDVAVSAMRKFEMTFDELIKKGWLDRAIEDYHQWTAMPDVLISPYESFPNNLVQETQKITQFPADFVKRPDGGTHWSKFSDRLPKRENSTTSAP